MDPIPVNHCGASNRAGQPCGRIPAAGRSRCHFHGGAQRSGAPPGNANAFKHGFYSTRVRDLATDILAAARKPFELRDEIALLRAVLARAAATAQPPVIVQIASALARLIAAQREIDPFLYLDDLPSADPLEQVQDTAVSSYDTILKEGDQED